MRAALHAKAIADEQRKRDLFHASHQVPRGSPPGSPLVSRYGGDKVGGDVARFLPKPPALTPIGSPSQTALPTRQSEVRRAPRHPRPYPPPLAQPPYPPTLAQPPCPPARSGLHAACSRRHAACNARLGMRPAACTPTYRRRGVTPVKVGRPRRACAGRRRRRAARCACQKGSRRRRAWATRRRCAAGWRSRGASPRRGSTSSHVPRCTSRLATVSSAG